MGQDKAFSFDPISSSYHPTKNNPFLFTNQYIRYYSENLKFPHSTKAQKSNAQGGQPYVFVSV